MDRQRPAYAPLPPQNQPRPPFNMYTPGMPQQPPPLRQPPGDPFSRHDPFLSKLNDNRDPHLPHPPYRPLDPPNNQRESIHFCYCLLSCAQFQFQVLTYTNALHNQLALSPFKPHRILLHLLSTQVHHFSETTAGDQDQQAILEVTKKEPIQYQIITNLFIV